VQYFDVDGEGEVDMIERYSVTRVSTIFACLYLWSQVTESRKCNNKLPQQNMECVTSPIFLLLKDLNI
jgi:hypothetical protein